MCLTLPLPKFTLNLEAALKESGIAVTVNDGFKPRKGTFEVKRGSTTFLSLVAMPRPFKALRSDLYMHCHRLPRRHCHHQPSLPN